MLPCALIRGWTTPEISASWLMTIAHRKAIDHHRANGRRPVPMAEVGEHIGSTADAPAGELDVNGGDGVWLAVRGLPPKQRAAVALRYACDLPHTEIAAPLAARRMPPAAASTRA